MQDPPENHEGTANGDPLDLVARALREHPDGITNTVELSERLEEVYGVERTSRQVLNDLRVLERVGEAHSKKLGANAVGWIHDDRLTPPPTSDNGAESGDRDHNPSRGGGNNNIRGGGYQPNAEPHPDQDTTHGVDEDGVGAMVDAEAVVAELDIPGSGERLEDRRRAILACIEWIRETGSGRKSEFLENIWPQHPAGYQSEKSWWSTIGKNGLHPAAKQIADIQPPSEGEHVYTIRPNVAPRDGEPKSDGGQQPVIKATPEK